MSLHTLSVLVEDQPGVLTRIAGLFSRRAFNITSLAVGPAERPGLSRMTIVVSAESAPLEQITRQLDKLVSVLSITELEPAAAVERELLLVTVRSEAATRRAVLELAASSGARVADASAGTVTLEATDTPARLEALLHVLQPYGVLALAQSGVVALGRGEQRPATITLPGQRVLN